MKFSTLFYNRKRIAYLKIFMMELNTKNSMKREFFLLRQRKLDLFCSLMVCHYLNHLVSQNSQFNFSTYMLSFFYSGQTLWPVQLCITNLPPNVRTDLRNLVLAGIWLGPVKPDMTILLQPILERIFTLHQNGIAFQTLSGTKCLRAKLLCGIFDLLARAAVLKLTQWNGRFGCTYCLDEGTQVGHVRLYLPSSEHIPQSEKHIKESVLKSSIGNPVFGVKGASVLTPNLNIVKDTPIDYMHGVLEGVTKTLLHKFWLNGKYKDYRF